MIELKIESIQSVIDEGSELIKRHWDEVAFCKDKVPVEPDWNAFKEIEAKNSLFVMVARDDGKLVGYAFFILHYLLHYKSCYAASNDAIFVAKEYRKKGLLGLRLIKQCEKELKKLGAHRIFWHVKPTNDWTPILKRMGYSVEDVIMGKYIKD
jgi:GNAT superfamily N-acetyltransferase